MERNEFLRTCGLGCLGLMAGAPLLTSCSPTVYVQKLVINNQISVGLLEFLIEGETEKYHRYILVKSEQLDYPIVVYRKSEKHFTSLLLRCTHRGTELNVHGDLISCPAHGSEFSNIGEVISEPAPQPLKSFHSEVIQNELIIHLL